MSLIEILIINGIPLSEIKEYYEINKLNDDICKDINNTFCITCEMGNLEISKWLFEINPNIYISANNNYAFRNACVNGYLEIVKWLIEIDIDNEIDISESNDYIFRITCRKGCLDIAKFLIEIKPDIEISAHNDYAFRYACSEGKLEIIKWLYEIKPDIYMDYEYSFYSACEGGNLGIVKWLYEIKPDIDFSINNDNIFRVTCENNHIEIALWIIKINPDRYSIIIENDNIIEYKINIIIKNTINKHDIDTDIEDCMICQYIMCNIYTLCNHLFCEDCIIKWIQYNTSCPYCRNNLYINDLKKII